MLLNQVLLGLGSNTDRETHLRAGLEALDEVLDDLRCSPVFESLPVGIRSGPFLNMVVSGTSRLPLTELDRRLKFIEADNGRYAPERRHPVVGRSFAELWAQARIDQQLWPVPFQWRGRELTPAALIAQYPRPA